MEAKMNPNNIEPIETATPAGMSDAAGLAAPASPEMGGRLRGRLLSGWRFTRHLLEMVAAMVVGMAVLGAAIWALGEPPGYASLFVEYGLMGASMSVPMVAWMRHRGHAWSDGGEMTAAMLAPMFALVLPVELGVVGLAGHSLMMHSHVAMIGGMIALMVYRWDRYAHGAHDRRE
jgi:flagellar biosynthetic protein FliP